MNLHEIGQKNKTDKALHHNYMEFYESHIGFLKDKKINLLEIGFLKGASILTWLDYFPRANIYCIDIIDVSLTHDRFFFHKISQDDSGLRNLFQDNFFSIIVDDGSHITSHQIDSLKLLWPKLQNGGFYLLEDLHTSFIPQYINTSATPYDFLKKKVSIPSLDHIHLSSEIQIFHRIPGFHLDSITSVIKKTS